MKITSILADVQSQLKAPKGQTNTFGKYKYRSCEDIVEAVKPLLAKHGAALLIGDEIVLIGDRYYIKATAKIILEDEAAETVAFAREPAEKKGMDLAQLTGATSSYARKYALNGLFAIDDTKDADTQDNSKEQISPEPINMKRVGNHVKVFKEIIDQDQIEEGHDRVKTGWKQLTNDERIAVNEQLTEKAPDSNKMYKSLLKEYIDYKEAR